MVFRRGLIIHPARLRVVFLAGLVCAGLGLGSVALAATTAQNPIVVLTIVVDNYEGHPVGNAKVTVSSTNMAEYTTDHGQATFSALPAGIYTVTAKSGDQASTSSVTLGATPSAQVTMTIPNETPPSSSLARVIGLFIAALAIFAGGIWWVSQLMEPVVPTADELPAPTQEEAPAARPITPPSKYGKPPAPSIVYRPGDPDGQPDIPK